MASAALAVVRAEAQGLGPALAASQAGSTWSWLPRQLPASGPGAQGHGDLLAAQVGQAVHAPPAATGFWVLGLGVTALVVIAWLAIRRKPRG